MNEIFDYTILEYVIDDISKPIILNPDTDEQNIISGFISNATLSPNSSYHLHSLNLFKRGDFFKMENGNYYMVTGDVVEKRLAKYKSVADYCNHVIPIYEEKKVQVGTKPSGEPIYKIEKILVGETVGVLRYKQFTSPNGSIIVINTEIEFTIRDTAKARETYKINTKVDIEGKSWNLIEVDYTKQGTLGLMLRSVL